MSYHALMRVITVNVCGIRSAADKGLFRWLRRQRADFVCLQETKSQEHQLDGHDVELAGYHRYFCDAERKGYAGVALYSRHRATAPGLQVPLPRSVRPAPRAAAAQAAALHPERRLEHCAPRH